jgi:hypothetical protein
VAAWVLGWTFAAVSAFKEEGSVKEGLLGSSYPGPGEKGFLKTTISWVVCWVAL